MRRFGLVTPAILVALSIALGATAAFAQAVAPLPTGGTSATRPVLESAPVPSPAPARAYGVLAREIASLRIALATRVWIPSVAFRADPTVKPRARWKAR
jgi:hypothetical protein